MSGRSVGAPGAMVIIISGPSGVGKDTILRELRNVPAHPPRHFVVTYKTRKRRGGEEHGVHYLFVSDAEFMALRDSGALLEATWVHDHWAGTPRDQVIRAVTSGGDALLKIDVDGADEVKRQIPGVVRIFIAPPSREVLYEQLKERGTETPAELRKRHEDADRELARQADYDHVVVNRPRDIGYAVAEIDRIIVEEHARNPDRCVSL